MTYLFVTEGGQFPPRDEHEVIAERVASKYPLDTIPDLPFQPVSLDRVSKFFADRNADPEIPGIVRCIKKRKTVYRQPFSLHGRYKILILSYPLVLAV